MQSINQSINQQYIYIREKVSRTLEDLPGASNRTSSGLAMGIFFLSAFSRILRIMGPIMCSRVVDDDDVDDDTDGCGAKARTPQPPSVTVVLMLANSRVANNNTIMALSATAPGRRRQR